MKGYIKVYNNCIECGGFGYVEDWYISEAKKKYPDFDTLSFDKKAACVATFPALYFGETKLQWAQRQLGKPTHKCGSCSGTGLHEVLVDLERFINYINPE